MKKMIGCTFAFAALGLLLSVVSLFTAHPDSLFRFVFGFEAVVLAPVGAAVGMLWALVSRLRRLPLERTHDTEKGQHTPRSLESASRYRTGESLKFEGFIESAAAKINAQIAEGASGKKDASSDS
jgi:hypothetical protein